MDPNHVLIHCPAGHELQADRANLDTTLCCPICKQTFTPGGGHPPAPTPTAVGYADGTVPLPVSPPGYVGWLIGLWIAAEGFSAIYGFASLGQRSNPQNPTPFAMLGSCFMLLTFIPAIVLQLMWIHRIHADALRARGYREVSPGQALGLSFIPVFNWIWTAWTLKKLAAFAASGGASPDAGADESVRSATLCLYLGIAKAVSNCVGFVIGGVLGFRAAMAAGPGGAPVNPFASAGAGFLVTMVLSTLVGVAAVLVYAWTVPKVQKSLYRFLGAPA